jgi:hypothetical protein
LVAFGPRTVTLSPGFSEILALSGNALPGG